MNLSDIFLYAILWLNVQLKKEIKNKKRIHQKIVSKCSIYFIKGNKFIQNV